MKTNAVYLRKSSIKEMNKFERQVKELVDTVKALDEPYEVYNDNEASSRNKLREEYVRMKQDIEAGKIKVVYIIDDSRLTRTDSEALQFYSFLKKKKVRLITLLNGEINLLDKQSMLVSKIKAIFNDFEYDNTVTKIEYGKRRAINSGAFIGKVPFGYTRDLATKKLVPNKDANTVGYVFQKYKEGYTTRGIAGELPGFTSSKVSRILRNRTYLGEAAYTSKYLEETFINYKAHTAIIDEELFQAVQLKLKSRKTRNL